jgi:hypothetical protein
MAWEKWGLGYLCTREIIHQDALVRPRFLRIADEELGEFESRGFCPLGLVFLQNSQLNQSSQGQAIGQATPRGGGFFVV